MARRKKRKKMRRGGGAAKGGQFERDMCGKFGLWWTKQQRDDIFWRTAGSGARATTRKKRGKTTCDQYGDMTCIDPIGKPLIDLFSFEFKNYKTYDVLGALQPVDPNKDWMQFWAKCYDDARTAGRFPFLVTKRNHGKILAWVMVSTKIELEAIGLSRFPEIAIALNARDVKVKSRTIHLPEQIICGFQLESFFKLVDPEKLKEYYSAQRCNNSESTSSVAAACERTDGGETEAP